MNADIHEISVFRFLSVVETILILENGCDGNIYPQVISNILWPIVIIGLLWIKLAILVTENFSKL